MYDIRRQSNGTWKKDLRLYVHVPFCVKKCSYCDFLSGPAGEDTIRNYFDALQTEIGSYQGRTDDYFVSSIFIGGGTPSSVDLNYITGLLDFIREVFIPGSNPRSSSNPPEVTIEVNPGTVDRKKLTEYRKAGINRLSFGLQSADDKELMLLGRIHSFSQFKENYLLARETGFTNINIDLMSALPGQTVKDWETTLHTVAELKPEHISAYSLIIEEGTPFHEFYGQGKKAEKSLPDEETDRQIYHRTKRILEEYGYHRYEISNYAREGFECRHNTAYWNLSEYLGLGLGASSLIDHTRFHNLTDLRDYINRCHQYADMHILPQQLIKSGSLPKRMDDLIGLRKDVEVLSEKQQMEECMFLGLRLSKGISKTAFYQRFGKPIVEIYGDVLKSQEKNGLVVVSGDRIQLTEYGIDISNRVLSDYLLD